MSTTTTIEWTEKTWNPLRGCSVTSPGCVNCYAMRQAHRFSGDGKPYHGLTKQTKAGPQWTGVVRTVPELLDEPLRWRKPALVFVNSMSDLFHERVPDKFIDRTFAVMALARRHTFQILTKRADRMRRYFTTGKPWQRIAAQAYEHNAYSTIAAHVFRKFEEAWPLPNVWLGVSCENQEQADKRIPFLLQTPAAVRWVSAEPLLGPIDFNALPDLKGDPSWDLSALHGVRECAFGATVSRESTPRLDWIVVGGESGHGARPCALEWIARIVRDSQAAGVPVFVKQLGARPYERYKVVGHGPAIIRLRDPKGGDINEFPTELRVREYPRVKEPTYES